MADIFGSDKNDVLYGSDEDDRIFGFDGDDEIFGGAGNDLIFGDGGNDTLDGGEGTDTLYGGLGDDVIRGGGGADLLYGEEGDDVIYADGMNRSGDRVFGGDGNDTLHLDLNWQSADAGEGDDIIYLNNYSSGGSVTGGAGNDTIFSAVASVCYGGDGDDVIYGTGTGEAGNDTIYGGEYGGDGGDGDDTIYCGSGAIGGNGNDQIINNIENERLWIEGGSGNDTITILAAQLVPAWVWCGDDDDVVYATNGYLGFISGGLGNDTIYCNGASADGGDGDDYIDGMGPNGSLINGGWGDDILLGGDGIDILSSTFEPFARDRDVMDGRGGSDAIRGGFDGDTLTGGGGLDDFGYYFVLDSAVGEDARDVITDFTSGEDKINLGGLIRDGERFFFIGTLEFSGLAREVRFDQQTDGKQVWIDNNADAVADMEIFLQGSLAGDPLLAADFFLHFGP